MTKQQIDALKMLIEADRRYHSLRAAGKLAVRNDRGIEIGSMGINRRTANSLIDAGLAEALDPGINSRPWLYLYSYEPYDDVSNIASYDVA